MPIPLHTDSLLLRTFVADDAHNYRELMLELRNDPDTRRFLNLNNSIGSEKKYKTLIIHPNNKYALAVVHKKRGLFIGTAGFLSATPELFIWLHKAYRNQGFGLEASKRLIHFAFEELSWDYVFGVVHPENEHSKKLIFKLKMSLSKIMPDQHETYRLNRAPG